MNKENLTKPLNEVKLEGRVGFDPVMRALPNGTYVTSFKFSHRLSCKIKDGTWAYEYDNYSVQIFHTDPEEYTWLKKGSVVHITGKFCMSKFFSDKKDEWVVFRFINASKVIDAGLPVINGSEKGTLNFDAAIYDDDIPF